MHADVGSQTWVQGRGQTTAKKTLLRGSCGGNETYYAPALADDKRSL